MTHSVINEGIVVKNLSYLQNFIIADRNSCVFDFRPKFIFLGELYFWLRRSQVLKKPFFG